MTLLNHILENTAGTYPDRLAVVHGQERQSYRYIDEKANRVANALQKAGIKKGDRVGVLMPNSVPYVCSYFGVLKMGGVAVPINTAINAEALIYILKDAGIRVLILHGATKAIATHLANEQSGLSILFTDQRVLNQFDSSQKEYQILRPLDEIFVEESCSPLETDISKDDLACLFYTSGSTGKPKGVMLSHANILENTKSIVSYLELTKDDQMMVVLPFFYCYGASLIHTHFMVGGSLVLENQFLYPNKILARMAEEKVTGFAGVPSTFAIFLRRSNIRSHNFNNLRYVTQAGGAMAPALIQELREALPRTQIFIMYGQTEASARLSFLPPNLLDQKLGSIGKGIPNVDLKVMDKEGNSVPPGEVGEIVALGPNIMKGYWNSPEETEIVLDAEGLHTGDLARVDEEGFIYIVDRKKDMIKSGSHRVSAKEIEETILEDSSILECAVIGIEDEMQGEVLKAFIVPTNRGEFYEEEIIKFCKKRLPPYKVPKYVEVVRSLPKNEAGKILKNRLKEQQMLKIDITK